MQSYPRHQVTLLIPYCGSLNYLYPDIFLTMSTSSLSFFLFSFFQFLFFFSSSNIFKFTVTVPFYGNCFWLFWDLNFNVKHIIYFINYMCQILFTPMTHYYQPQWHFYAERWTPTIFWWQVEKVCSYAGNPNFFYLETLKVDFNSYLLNSSHFNRQVGISENLLKKRFCWKHNKFS